MQKLIDYAIVNITGCDAEADNKTDQEKLKNDNDWGTGIILVPS